MQPLFSLVLASAVAAADGGSPRLDAWLSRCARDAKDFYRRVPVGAAVVVL